MEPNDDGSSGLAPRPSAPLTPNAGALRDTRPLPPVAVPAPARAARANMPGELAGMLLPGEAVTLRSSPHPFIFVGPIVRFGLIAAVLVTLLLWKLWVVVNGHHTFVPLLTGPVRLATLALGGLLMVSELAGLIRLLFHYVGFRVITTNRRVFIVDGLLGRTVTPLGNTALAGATMSQGLAGRIFGFGTIVLPSNARRTELAAMRDPVALYRELQAVANGVDGDTWTPAVRQTLIP